MKKYILPLMLVFAVAISSCCRDKETKTVEPGGQTLQDSAVLSFDSAYREFVKNEHMVLATLYQQTAAEYRALCYQAFNIGKFMLDADLNDKSVDKHRIIVLDVDETVLDNSPFQAKSVLESTSYPVNWDKWCNMANAEPLPALLNF